MDSFERANSLASEKVGKQTAPPYFFFFTTNWDLAQTNTDTVICVFNYWVIYDLRKYIWGLIILNKKILDMSCCSLFCWSFLRVRQNIALAD